MIQVSIVSGTYNRLPLLKRMVESVRTCVEDLSYEIILVDGGSTDGTLEWCREQDDVTLIEQGELLGAVKAFNAGFDEAKGKYVAILNDDIVVKRNTIKIAYDYLEKHSDVGQVAFYNETVNRTPKRTYVDRAFGYVYGQCCMIRRWLGDFAGWWGTEYHTYAGDTQLSMVLWEHGWKVVPIRECVILDYRYQDELRANRKKLLGDIKTGKNVDTVKFYQEWTGRLPDSDDWIGVRRRDLWCKALDGKLATLRLKIVSSKGVHRTTMIEAFTKLGRAKQIDQRRFTRSNNHTIVLSSQLFGIVKEFEPDLLLTQIQGSNKSFIEALKLIKTSLPRISLVNIDGDARFPLLPYHFDVASVVDLQLVSSATAVQALLDAGHYNVGFLSKSPEGEFLDIERDSTHSFDVLFLGNHYHNTNFPEKGTRIAAIRALLDAGIRTTVYGNGWDKFEVEVGQSTIGDRIGNAKKYSRAKLALSISAFTNLYGYSSNRLWNICATGCPALVQRFDGMEELGFIDGETCIAWTTLDELVEKAKYALDHDDWREEIGRAGRELMLARHTYEHRVAEILSMLESLEEVSCFKTRMY